MYIYIYVYHISIDIDMDMNHMNPRPFATLLNLLTCFIVSPHGRMAMEAGPKTLGATRIRWDFPVFAGRCE